MGVAQLPPQVTFRSGAQVKIKKEVTYLGVVLNSNLDVAKEVSQRLAACNAVFQRMNLFWRKSSCSVKEKVVVFQSFLLNKLLYGLDSVQLNIRIKIP